jgi:hypothetical protein
MIEGMYDPERLLDQAEALRAAAETADPARRAIYLSQAGEYEALVQRSVMTQPISDPDTFYSAAGELIESVVASVMIMATACPKVVNPRSFSHLSARTVPTWTRQSFS